MIPIARKKTHRLSKYQTDISDDFAWLRNSDDPDVLQYLQEENQFYHTQNAHTKDCADQLYREMQQRIPTEDASVPYQDGGWWYYHTTSKNKAYRCHYRKKNREDTESCVVLDENQRAENLAYYHLGSLVYNPSHTMCAWTEDCVGDERYSVHIATIHDTHSTIVESISCHKENLCPSVTWINDTTLVYIQRDATERPYRIRRKQLHTPSTLLLEEKDPQYMLHIQKSKNKEWIFCKAESKNSSEIYVLSTKNDSIQCLFSRKKGVKYDVYAGLESWYIRSNHENPNFALYRCAYDTTELMMMDLGHTKDTFLEDLDVFAHHILLWTRQNGVAFASVYCLRMHKTTNIPFPDAIYDIYPAHNHHFYSNHCRIIYSSPLCPNTTIEYHMDTMESNTLKQECVPDFDPAQFTCFSIWATGFDGTAIPISIVLPKEHTSKNMIVYGYGAYGISYPLGFDNSWVSLLNRGVGIAVVHVRGGGELGQHWYEQGKMFQKKNGFSDCIYAIDHLVQQGITTYDSIALFGTSAGGLLMGAVINQRPDIAKCCVLQVPFVDVLHTMLDASLPLTTLEYEEWGNPKEEQAFLYIHSYCPYHNIQPHLYPNTLVTTSVQDTRVGYWEAAKWVAKVRNISPHSQLYLHCSLDGGHSGSSGIFGYIKEMSTIYAFILDQF